ncbi:hypothetical protein V2I01_05805 [Micromonospora sp. BRA006-A]|nr:hypothetical protein [Micromonospora sp. BRA006-A]
MTAPRTSRRCGSSTRTASGGSAARAQRQGPQRDGRPRVSLALEDGVHPVVAEGVARPHRADFPPAIVAAFAEKYGGWDIRQPVTPDGERVLLEVPARRWLLAGTAR